MRCSPDAHAGTRHAASRRSIHPVSACSVYPVYPNEERRKERKSRERERERERESTRGRRSLIRTPLKSLSLSLGSLTKPHLALSYVTCRPCPFCARFAVFRISANASELGRACSPNPAFPRRRSATAADPFFRRYMQTLRKRYSARVSLVSLISCTSKARELALEGMLSAYFGVLSSVSEYRKFSFRGLYSSDISRETIKI